MPVHVSACTMQDLENDPRFFELVDEYGRESVIPELGNANPQLQMYHALESAGALKVISAHDGEKLIGFMMFVILPTPHQGALTATVQSFFVGSEHRKFGAGLKILKEAEKIARSKGAIGFFASAPIGGRLASVLPAKSYRPVTTSFFKGL